MSMIKKTSTRRSEDAMDDDSDDRDSKRKSRNLSEKKRRDQFNLLINELSSMVSSGGRKMDKSTVLKSTISFLKNHDEVSIRSRVHEIQEDWKPSFLTNDEFTHLVLEAVDGFIIVFSTSGHILYTSESITTLLEHLPNDVVNMTLYELAFEDEQSILYNTLLNHTEEEGQISFSCHIRRGRIDNQLPCTYELVHFHGYFTSNINGMQIENNRYNGYSGEGDTRLVFVGTGRLQSPLLIREMSLIDLHKNEFTSRHSLEWKFLFLDHRAPSIIGYLPFELLGTSGYDYYHVDDLDNVISCHEALMQKGEGTSCYYRFLTKGQQWIWLQTRFYITYHQWNSKPEFIVCTHKVVSYIDVKKYDNKNEEVSSCMEESTASSNNSVGLTSWTNNGAVRSRFSQGPPSECTSVSADSPTSKRSPLHSYARTRKNQGKASSYLGNQQLQPTYLEVPTFVATIPLQPVITKFPSSETIISQLSINVPVENPLPSDQNQFHVKLQQKQAELEASIGQQQAELRKISEQLIMSRFGILPPSSQSPVNISYVSSNGDNTDNTLAPLQGVPSAVPVNMPLTMTIPANVENNEVLTPLVTISRIDSMQSDVSYSIADTSATSN